MKEEQWIHIPYKYKKKLNDWQRYYNYNTEDKALGKMIAYKLLVGSTEYISLIQLLEKENAEYCIFRREYIFTDKEKKSAEILLLWVDDFAEDSEVPDKTFQVCDYCRRKTQINQVGNLYVDYQHIKKYDLCETYSGNSEIIVSQKLKDIFEHEGITGADFQPVCQLNKENKIIDGFYHLQLKEGIGEVVEPSIIDKDEKCPKCSSYSKFLLKGLLYFNQETYKELDICYTKDYFGSRNKDKLVVISQRLYKVLIDNKIESFDVQPAYLTR